MSLDYPFYEELCRRGHRAAKWWRIGDCLYYLGLLTALVAAAVGLALVGSLFGAGGGWLLWSVIAFVGGAVVFVIGSALKGYSYRLAERDGIKVSDY